MFSFSGFVFSILVVFRHKVQTIPRPTVLFDSRLPHASFLDAIVLVGFVSNPPPFMPSHATTHYVLHAGISLVLLFVCSSLSVLSHTTLWYSISWSSYIHTSFKPIYKTSTHTHTHTHTHIPCVPFFRDSSLLPSFLSIPLCCLVHSFFVPPVVTSYFGVA